MTKLESGPCFDTYFMGMKQMTFQIPVMRARDSTREKGGGGRHLSRSCCRKQHSCWTSLPKVYNFCFIIFVQYCKEIVFIVVLAASPGFSSFACMFAQLIAVLGIHPRLTMLISTVVSLSHEFRFNDMKEK